MKSNANPIQLAQAQPPRQGQQMNPLTELRELRDLHEPEPVSAWPPAPGWWLLALLLLAALLVLTVKALKYNRKRAYRREASHQLMLAREQYRSSGDGNAYAQALLEILKRTALTAYPRDHKRIANLHGEEWLKFLDSTCASCNFRSPEGQGLLQAAYSAEADAFALQQCYSQANLWIAGHRSHGGQLRA